MKKNATRSGNCFDLICLGSGPAGQRAAIQAAKFGKRVALVERQQMLGGVCVVSGTIPSKTFREAVMSITGGHPLTTDGIPPDELPTAQRVLSRVADVCEHESRNVHGHLRRNGVKIFAGVGRFQDPHAVIVENEGSTTQLQGDKILVAVGTRPAPIPRQPKEAAHLLNSDEILNIRELPRTLIVVGGGVIGIEYASMFAALGVEVTLIEKRERPLEFLDREILDELIHQMRDRELTFRFGEAVEKLEVIGKPPRASVTLESGKRIVADLVLFAAGRAGATDELNLKAAGLTADDRGRLKVDAGFRTEVPHIFAAGDVIGFPSLAATSSEQGRLAACQAFEMEAEPMSPNFPVGIYAIPEISMVGAPEHELTKNKVPYEFGIARFREIARGQILGDESGMLKLLFHRETRLLLGVHIIGTGATELVHIGQVMMDLGGGLDYLLKTVFNYPTLAECYKVSALDAFNKMSE